MPFAAALSTIEATLQAIEEVCRAGPRPTGGYAGPGRPVFLAAPRPRRRRARGHGARTSGAALPARLRRRVRHRQRPGDRAESGHEPVDQPLGAAGDDGAVSPGAGTDGRRSQPARLARRAAGADGGSGAVLLLGDPFTFPIDLFLRRVNEDARRCACWAAWPAAFAAPASAGCSIRTASRTRAPSACCCRDRSACARSCRRAAGRSAGTWSSPGPRTTSSSSWAARRRLPAAAAVARR